MTKKIVHRSKIHPHVDTGRSEMEEKTLSNNKIRVKHSFSLEKCMTYRTKRRKGI